MDDSLATARAILVGSAVLALVVALAVGQWLVAAILAAGVTVHTVHILLHRRSQQDAARDGEEATPTTA